MVLKGIIPVIIVGKICVYILQNGQELLSALSNDWGNLTKDVRKLIWTSKIVIKSTLNVELQLHKRVRSNSAASRLVMCLLLVLKNEDWNEFNLLVVWFSISYWGRKKRKLNACLEIISLIKCVLDTAQLAKLNTAPVNCFIKLCTKYSLALMQSVSILHLSNGWMQNSWHW